MTAMCVALDPKTGCASVVGAGHPPLLVARKCGRTDSIASSAPPLGIRERSAFLETHIELERGEAFFLYTDGLTGLAHEKNPRLSSERLGEMLQPLGTNAETLLNRVMEQSLMKYPEKRAPDDVAAVVVRRSN